MVFFTEFTADFFKFLYIFNIMQKYIVFAYKNFQKCDNKKIKSVSCSRQTKLSIYNIKMI